MLRGGGKLLHSIGFAWLLCWNNYRNPNFLFVIASESEAISNKLKDCHVAIAPRNDAKRKVAFTLAEIKPSRVRSLDNEMTKSLKVSSVGTFNARRSVAFTLAEILITLAIIGVVSAMTIPNLITKNQKKIVESRITEDYSIIQQALRLQHADGLDMSVESIPDYNAGDLKDWYNKYFAPYLKTTQVCYDSKGCWQDKTDTKALSGVTALYSRKGIGVGYDIITVRLLNGTSMCIDSWSGPRSRGGMFGVTTSAPTLVTIYVDANGDSNPNTIGKDIYVFVYARETGLVPAGYSKTREEVKQNCSTSATGEEAGLFCMSRIKLESWKILDQLWDANK